MRIRIIIITMCFLAACEKSITESQVDDAEHIKGLEKIQAWMVACGNGRSFVVSAKTDLEKLIKKGEAAVDAAYHVGLNAYLKVFPEKDRKEAAKDYQKCLKDNSEENPVTSVSIFRDIDMTQVGVKDGKPFYKIAYLDTLTFNKYVEDYDIQALSENSDWKYTLTYFKDGKERTPALSSKRDFGGVIRTFATIKVEGKEAQVRTTFEHTGDFDPKEDKTWGIGFVSSLPISGIRAKINLADGKKICGANLKNEQFHSDFREGCQQYPVGNPAELICDKTFSNKPNTALQFIWHWNVWEPCPTKTAKESCLFGAACRDSDRA